jgi:hypothetical protein
MKQLTRLFVSFLVVLQLGQGLQARTTDARFDGHSLDKVFFNPNDDNKSFRDYHLFEMDVKPVSEFVRGAGDEFTMRLRLGESFDWDFMLQIYDLRSSNYALRVSGPNGVATYPRTPARTYRGFLKSDSGSQVRMTITGDYIAGLVALGNGENYYFENVDKFGMLPGKKGAVLLYNLEDVTFRPGISREAVHPDMPALIAARRGLPSAMIQAYDCNEAEIALVGDYSTYSKCGSVNNTETIFMSILNLMDYYYEMQTIRYKLVETYISTDPATEPWSSTTDGGDLLTEFDNWANSGGLGAHDIATFWTGRAIGYSYAWLDTMCTSTAHHLVEFWGLGDEQHLANFQTHEAGHTWGAKHIKSPGNYIMSPGIAGGILPWHDRTTREFPDFISKALPCLSPCGAPEPILLMSFDNISGDNNGSGTLDEGETAMLNIDARNVGDVASGNTTITLTAGANNQYVTLNTTSVNTGVINAGQTTPATFSISVDPAAPRGTEVEFNFIISDGVYSSAIDVVLPVGMGPAYLMENTTVTTCRGIFYDTGGEFGNYNNDANLTMTFYPSEPGSMLEFDFVFFETEIDFWDVLQIFDGTTTTAPQIGADHCGSDSPGVVRATNPDGALTFHFYSDFAVTRPGWKAIISCITAQ